MSRISLILVSLFALAGCGNGDQSHMSSNITSTSVADMTPIERGAILFKRCRACHTLNEGGRNKSGPNLWGVFDRAAGAREDFNYSTAMKESGIVWTDEAMSAYLKRPSEFIPGNRMSYAGLRVEEDRLALIEYLRTNTGGTAASGG